MGFDRDWETKNKNVNETTLNLRDNTLDKLEETEEGQKILEQVVDYLEKREE